MSHTSSILWVKKTKRKAACAHTLPGELSVWGRDTWVTSCQCCTGGQITIDSRVTCMVIFVPIEWMAINATGVRSLSHGGDHALHDDQSCKTLLIWNLNLNVCTLWNNVQYDFFSAFLKLPSACADKIQANEATGEKKKNESKLLE